MSEKIIETFTIDGYGDDEVKYIKTDQDHYYQLSWSTAQDIPDNEIDLANSLVVGSDFNIRDFDEFEYVECDVLNAETYNDEKEYAEDENDEDEEYEDDEDEDEE
jgi:hypothetical protein